ncbi:MAG: glycoside hydrolase family 2 [Lachnospiraceae bacterium]|nr:glycoside hydrolase family 2 [Lachnospiraceae bacterium]
MKQLYTPWGMALNRDHVLEEYPRELLKRKSYINLNGYWDYAITKGEEQIGKFVSRILVPFSPESVLSGVSRQLQPDETLWYHRYLPELSGRNPRHRIVLHFGAVDQCCEVIVNGKSVARHVGGYLPFGVDITDYLKPVFSEDDDAYEWTEEWGRTEEGAFQSSEGEETRGTEATGTEDFQGRRRAFHTGKDRDLHSSTVTEGDGTDEVIVKVRDFSDTSFHAKGKQRLKRGGMYYTAVSGIWQTVWIEEIPSYHIDNIETVPDIENGYVSILVESDSDLPVRVRIRRPIIAQEDTAEIEEDTLLQGVIVAGMSNQWMHVRIPKMNLWTCEEPWLYFFDVTMGEDLVSSYFAMRTISMGRDEKGIPRIFLNKEEIFLRGVLDQGYWPDGIYTAPSDAAMVFDLTQMRRFGFNCVRKHAKIEPDRWYYHCDRLGLLVWQDIVNGGEPYKDWFVTGAGTRLSWMGIPVSDEKERLLSRENEAGRQEFQREIVMTAEILKEHPCIFAWTIFNEGWGQFETERCTELLRNTDPAHLIDSASGWFDQGCGDFRSVHYYHYTFRVKPEKNRAFVLSEFGGLPYPIPEHSTSEKVYGYGTRYKDREEFAEAFHTLIERMEACREEGLCAYIYTQWTDIEDEVNGIYTYDRKVRKADTLLDSGYRMSD